MSIRSVFLLFIYALASAAGAQTPPYGLTERAANTSFLISTSGPPTEMGLRRVFARRKTHLQVALVHAGDGSGRLFSLGKEGIIQVWYPREQPREDEIRHAAVFLVITDRVNVSYFEAGLFSMAFHPDYADNGKFYLHYAHGELFSRISEFRVSSNPDSADAASERILLEVEKHSTIHFGGQLAFGSDGYLYIALGDGSYMEAEERLHPAQDLTDLQGSILRIDVDGRSGELAYGIPPDNPLVGNERGWRQEIWAWGLRNPWRFSFDRQTGNLWAGDVGSSFWEEVNLIQKGKNYGWPIVEGNSCRPPAKECDSSGLTAPVVAYEHRGHASVTGGYVYRGTRLPHLQGAYLYGDFIDGRIWALRYEDGQVIDNRVIAISPSELVSFGEDEAGEVYIAGFNGTLYILDEKSADAEVDEIPHTLSSSGLFSQIASQTPSAALIPYSVNAQLWADGAFKTRLIALPGTDRIGFSPEGFWQFPNGTTLVKNFYLEMERGNPESRQIIETRLLVKNARGEQWSGLSYQWNDEGTDATLLEDSHTQTYSIVDAQAPEGRVEQTYYFPSRTDCTVCHTRAAGYVLGVHTAQLNKMHTYGLVEDHQLRSFNHIGLFFNGDIGEDYNAFPRQPDPADDQVEVAARARSYLDANCGQCHRPGGTARSNMDLRFSTPLAQTGAVDVAPALDDLGAADARLISPGAPERSVLYLRMLSLDKTRMPPLATSVVDREGAELVRQWILTMPGSTYAAEEVGEEPQVFQLAQNFPNPFNSSTIIRYQLGLDARVQLTVFDLLGRKIKTLAHQVRPAGAHAVAWDGADERGRPVASGVYLYRLETGAFSRARKLVLIR